MHGYFQMHFITLTKHFMNADMEFNSNLPAISVKASDTGTLPKWRTLLKNRDYHLGKDVLIYTCMSLRRRSNTTRKFLRESTVLYLYFLTIGGINML